jgi:hypothetical protein
MKNYVIFASCFFVSLSFEVNAYCTPCPYCPQPTEIALTQAQAALTQSQLGMITSSITNDAQWGQRVGMALEKQGSGVRSSVETVSEINKQVATGKAQTKALSDIHEHQVDVPVEVENPSITDKIFSIRKKLVASERGYQAYSQAHTLDYANRNLNVIDQVSIYNSMTDALKIEGTKLVDANILFSGSENLTYNMSESEAGKARILVNLLTNPTPESYGGSVSQKRERPGQSIRRRSDSAKIGVAQKILNDIVERRKKQSNGQSYFNALKTETDLRIHPKWVTGYDSKTNSFRLPHVYQDGKDELLVSSLMSKLMFENFRRLEDMKALLATILADRISKE